jgi:hypothetical protein
MAETNASLVELQMLALRRAPSFPDLDPEDPQRRGATAQATLAERIGTQS